MDMGAPHRHAAMPCRSAGSSFKLHTACVHMGLTQPFPLQVCRTYNFGQVGASQGQFYRRFLKPIKLNEEDVDWMQQDLTYLDPVVYERNLNATLAAARCAGPGLDGLHPAHWCTGAQLRYEVRFLNAGPASARCAEVLHLLTGVRRGQCCVV